jgi:hypothetical protein
LILLHVDPEAHEVHPEKLMPPHWPYLAVPHDGVSSVGSGVGSAGLLDVTSVVGVAGLPGLAGAVLSPAPQAQTAGPGTTYLLRSAL